MNIFGSHHFRDHHADGSSAYKEVLSAENIAKVMFLSAASYGLGFYMSYLLLRYLSISQYGDVMVAWQILTVASTVLLMGTKNVSKRFLIFYLREKSKRYIDFIWWHMGYIFRLFLGFSIAYTVFVLLFVALDSMGLFVMHKFHIAFWSLASAPLYAFAMILTIYLLAFGFVLTYDFIVEILLNLLWVFLIFSWMYWAPDPSNWDLVCFLVAQSLLFFSILLVCTVTLLKKPLKHVFSHDQDHLFDTLWIKDRFSSLLIDLYSSFPVMILLLVLEVLGANDNLPGHYSLCLSISVLFYIIPQSIYPLIFSSLDLLVKKRGEDLACRALLKRANRIVLVADGLILLSLVFYGRKILALFGQGSLAVYHLLLVFSLISCIGGLYYPVLNFGLISQGESKFIGRWDMAIYVIMLVGVSLVTLTVGGEYAVYLYGLLVTLQCVTSSIRFKRLSGFFIFELV